MFKKKKKEFFVVKSFGKMLLSLFLFSLSMISMMTVDAATFLPGVKKVHNWSEFETAMKDNQTGEIILGKDIDDSLTNKVINLNKSIKITGTTEGNVINFGSTTDNKKPSVELSNTSGNQIVLNNLVLTGDSSKNGTLYQESLFFSDSGKWDINMTDVSMPETSTRRMVHAPLSTVTVDGGSNQFDSEAGTNKVSEGPTKYSDSWFVMFRVKNMVIKNEAKVKADLKETFILATEDDSVISIEGKSKLELAGKSSPLIAIDANKGGVIKVDGNSNVRTEWTSLWIDRLGGGIAVNSPEAHIIVNNGSFLDLWSAVRPTIVMQSKGGVFDVDNKSRINAIQEASGKNQYGAAIRFRVDGNMTFNIKKQSEFRILTKSAGDSYKVPSIRMSGSGNAINVSEGGRLYVTNRGNGTAVEFETGINGFKLLDDRSKVDLKSDNKVITSSGGVEVVGEKGTEFVAIGNDSTSVFDSSGVSDYEFNNMLFFDFRNNNGAKAIDSSSSSRDSTFNSVNSEHSIWKTTKDENELDRNPYATWANSNIGLSRKNFTTVLPTFTFDVMPSLIGQQFSSGSKISEVLGDTRGKTSLDFMARISGNNAKPIVDEIRTPTTADKNIYAHVIVPEGLDMIRDAWDDEVEVTFEFTDTSGAVQTLIGHTNAQKVYGEGEKAGIVKVPIPGNRFLKEGEKVKVVKATRHGINGDGQDIISQVGTPDDGNVGYVADDEGNIIKEYPWFKDYAITEDVTPPETPVIDSSVINNAMKKISGKAKEEGTKVFIKTNDTWLKDDSGALVTTTSAAGKWELTLPRALPVNTKVEIYYKDSSVVSDKVKGSPETQTKEPDNVFGNLNVAKKDYSNYPGYHDAIDNDRFKPSFVIDSVSDAMPPTPRISKIARALTKDKNGDQKPQTDYDTDVRPEDWKGTITKVNNTLSYRIVVQIPGKTGEDKDKILYNANVTDKLPDGLAFDKSKVKVWKYTKGNTADGGMPYRHETDVNEGGTRKFNMGDIDIAKSEATEFTDKASIDYKEDTRMLTVGIGDTTAVPETEYIGANEYGILLPGDNIVIEVPTVVTPQAVKSDIKNKATIKGFGGVIETEDPLTYKEVTADSNVAVNPGGKVVGELLIKTAPETITFATTKLIDYNKSIGADKTSLDKPLVVKDTLKDKDWQVNVTLIKDMTYTKNGRDYTLPKSLNMRYKNKNQVMEVGEPQLVYKSDLEATPLGQEEFDISDDWKKPEDKDGIKMKASKIPQAGTYVGTVQWSLENTQ